MPDMPEAAGPNVDAHAHHIPPRLLDAAQRDGKHHSVSVEKDDNGRWVIQLGRGPAKVVPTLLVDQEACLRQMETLKLDVRILSGWNEVFGYELDAADSAWWCSLQNDMLAETIAEEPTRLAGLATIPLQDPGLAAAELRRSVKDLGLRGAFVATHVRGANLDAEELDAFWAAACELGVPVVVHPGSASLNGDRMSRYFLANVVGNPAETTIAAASLIFGGVLERFPELRVMLVHGGGFLPYQLGRLQKAYQVRSEITKSPGREPIPASRRFYFDTLLHHAPALGLLLEIAGADRLIFGTDFPFEMAEHRSVEEWLAPKLLDPGAIRAAAGGNAVKLFGLNVS